MTDRIEREPTPRRPELVPVKDPVGRLVADLRAVRKGGTIRIFCGEASPAIYNVPPVSEALDYAKRVQQATIFVSAGPIVVLDGSAFNELLSRRERRLVDAFYIRPIRGHDNHFRVVDADDGYRYYTEPPHRPLTLTKDCHEVDLSRVPPQELYALAEAACAFFDRSIQRATQVDGTPPGTSPVLLLTTVFGLRTLIEAADRREVDFDTLGPTDLHSLASAEDGRWCSVEQTLATYPGEWILMKIAAFDAEKNPSHGQIVVHSTRSQALLRALQREAPRPEPPEAPYYTFKATPRVAELFEATKPS